ncbi:hypothetical protein [Mycolicibacterium smegmatis]|uniref:Transmembrane protein n=3 Tax=Mycolicibacterium smegmatis TaxID=1772 RepID=A0QTI4_MYCS2|nr:hypothetical protein [Mycolicibacterium smegmatis]ABK76050.1 hypothetical protein MSMEG_1856 [Mycolicibacterium smegmatis MC2 155]AIU07078.1 hypothetical protein LJ00_09260 [Mycolicibacterium smegmatis MC2 155]AIU13703.1 hypothetical protein LI99_09260 [Mycolicibacterium smegmatis]AIU20327.1 hypothetical protein LI98_09260 [Mycolicibacterium smegmatis]AWT52842.1 hypothetical protein D806_018590 [Mycolicibacterium smegmatis MKD8]
MPVDTKNGTIVFPVWSIVLLACAVVLWASCLVISVRSGSATTERRFYWIGYFGAGGLAIVGLSFRGWDTVVWLIPIVVIIPVFYAFVRTPYLVVGGRVISLGTYEPRDLPEDSDDDTDRPLRQVMKVENGYGSMTAPKFWWLMTVFAALIALGAYLGGWAAPIVVGTTLLSGGLFIAGISDGRRGNSIVRGQFVPATVGAVSSLPLFGFPVLGYALGYLLGWALRDEHVEEV